MSLIEESLRRQKDATLNKVKGSTSAPAANAPAATQPATQHSWAPTSQKLPEVTTGENRRAPGWLMVFAVLLVGLAVWQLWGSRERVMASLSSSGPSVSSQAAGTQTASASNTPASSPAAAQTASSGLQALTARKSPRAAVLQGVVLGGDKPYALINGQIFKRGDPVGDATLVEIEPKRVVLKKKSGEQFILAMAD